jgi:hypothetical protein
LESTLTGSMNDNIKMNCRTMDILSFIDPDIVIVMRMVSFIDPVVVLFMFMLSFVLSMFMLSFIDCYCTVYVYVVIH